ncbi:hypothetical protein BJX62DRAFT_229350 [Aspergillus germanicus]
MLGARQLLSTTRPESPSTRQATVHDESLFHFTRGRFLTNESQESTQRHAPFNVDELAKLAVRAAEETSNGRRECIDIEKLADGMHNKAIRFTMDDGFQIIGKVPNPNAGLPHYTTASEVATMDFIMRSVSSFDNTVAAEYILMENASGVSLSKIWDNLDVDLQFKVLKKIATHQRAWSDSDSGLCYTKKDGKEITDERFTVGLSISRQNVDCGRAKMDFDRGPWRTVEDYERVTGLRELSCVENMPQLPHKKVFTIQSYLKLVEHLIPEDENITTSHLWNDDIHVENVFLADIRALFEDEPEPVAKRKADSLFTKMSLKMPRLLKALEFRQTASFHMLLLARNLLIDGEATYLGGVRRISQGTQNAPLSFPPEEIQRIKQDAEAAAKPMELMGGSGLVSHEQFRELEKTLPKVKEEFAKMHAQSEEEKVELNHAWPFDVADRGERSAQAEEE